MTDLADWLLEQTAEDEQLARAAARLHDDDPEEPSWDTIVGGLEDAGWEPEAVRRLDPHVSNWDPARVLAECDAKRRIIEHANDQVLRGHTMAGLQTLRLLALPYTDCPGYRDKWRPYRDKWRPT